MKNALISFFTLLVIVPFLSVPVSANDSTELLKQARALVEKKSYAEALKIYESVKEELQANADLEIEWARVYTYADLHPEAITLFEDVRKNHPEKEKEILKELADQYKWNGDKAKAIVVYRHGLELDPKSLDLELGLAQAQAWNDQHREALRSYDAVLSAKPDDTNALLGKAEVLSWDDDLEEALRIYEGILKRDPRNISAQNGMARVSVWQGYYREGEKIYTRILSENPGNADALEGRAYAYHWGGEDVPALNDLEVLLKEHRDRHAARELYREIKNAKMPHVIQSNRFSYDRNYLDIFSENVHAGAYVNDSIGAGASYNLDTYRQRGKTPVHGDRGGMDFGGRLNESAEAHSYMQFSRYDVNDNFTPFTTNSWFTLYPNDAFRVDLSYDRETFQDIDSLNNGIITNSGGVSCDWRPNRFWYFSAKYKGSKYNDRNQQNTVFAKGEYRILRKAPYLKFYYNYYYSDWSRSLNSGYFNPMFIRSHVGGLYGSLDLTKRIFVEGQGSMGYESQNPKSDHPTYFGGGTVNYRVFGNWTAFARAEYFLAADTNPEKKYYNKSVWFGLTYSFGAEEEPYLGQQSQRPIAR